MGKKNEVREIWKDVVGYEGLYQVSSLGRVKNLSSKREPTYGAKHDKGYLRVTLKKAGEKDTSPLVHQLVAKAFIPNPDCKPTVDHINEDKKDNRVENLRWATYSENQLNSVESRSSVREKLSPKQVELVADAKSCVFGNESTFTTSIVLAVSIHPAALLPISDNVSPSLSVDIDKMGFIVLVKRELFT